MRLSLLFCLIAAAAAAPQQPSPKPEDRQEMYRMLDEIRTDIRGDDWSEAWRASMRLSTAIYRFVNTQVAPDLELKHLEMLAGKDAISRGPYLARLTRTAYAAGDLPKAESYANDALAAAKVGVFWWTGNAIHQGNIVLGRLALRRGDLEAAKKFLLLAGKTPESSTLAALGPSMALAKELLDHDETAVVLQYFDECRDFWTGNRGKLNEWTVLIKGGIKPDFGANLGY